MSLSYADAARLLGGRDSKVLQALEKLADGALLGGALTVPGLLGLLGAKNEVARLGQDLLRGLAERRAGLSRYDRTQLLEAAHAVLVATAYFEAIEEVDLPLPVRDLELTTAEEVMLAGGRQQGSGYRFDSAMVLTGPPEPHGTYESVRIRLLAYYETITHDLDSFATGLAVHERLDAAERVQFAAGTRAVPQLALQRYEELLRRLATEFPEVAYWSNMQAHRATQNEVRRLGDAMASLERNLAVISTGRAPDARRAGLARACGTGPTPVISPPAG